MSSQGPKLDPHEAYSTLANLQLSILWEVHGHFIGRSPACSKAPYPVLHPSDGHEPASELPWRQDLSREPLLKASYNTPHQTNAESSKQRLHALTAHASAISAISDDA